jgi:hypothetical protein
MKDNRCRGGPEIRAKDLESDLAGRAAVAAALHGDGHVYCVLPSDD